VFKTVDFKDAQEGSLLIDLRSPKEYEEATIPGAINIPIFTNEERHDIGYVYVNESVEKAKQMGVEAVSRKLPEIYEKISRLDKEHRKLIFFCARGGMRSSSICSLFTTLGINAYKLNNGYKGYRKFINENLIKVNENVKYIVLHGKTGVGKTEILKELATQGYDVLDLEYAANHRGSLLGNVGLGSPRSQKAFESIAYEILNNRKSDYVFVEAESKRVGNIILPEFIHKSMREGRHILVEASLEFRADLLTKEYTKETGCKEEINNALNYLGKYMSEENINKYKSLIQVDGFEEVATELMLKHYDPMYQSEIKKYEYDLVIEVEEIQKSCEQIKEWFKKQIKDWLKN
jgi:tRNA 2-selenouridine synthase